MGLRAARRRLKPRTTFIGSQIPRIDFDEDLSEFALTPEWIAR
jgi:hypothetical protein